MNVREGTRRLALLLGAIGAILGGFISYVELQPVMHQRALHERFEQLANSGVAQQERKVLRASTPEVESTKQSFQYIKLPDGSYGKFRADADDAAIVAAIEKDFPQAKPWLIYQSLAKRIGGPDFIPEKEPSKLKTPPAPATYTKQQARSSEADIDPWDKAAADSGAMEAWQQGEPSKVNKGGIKNIYWTAQKAISSIETEDGQMLYPTEPPSVWLSFLAAMLPILGFFVPWGVVRAIGWVGVGFSQPSK